jgi:hypothetical protein
MEKIYTQTTLKSEGCYEIDEAKTILLLKVQWLTATTVVVRRNFITFAKACPAQMMFIITNIGHAILLTSC